MELTVAEAAERLGVHPSRVRTMLRHGQLQGRLAGRQWLIGAEDVSLVASHMRLPGRPLAPARAWGLLDLLDGGQAPWLAPTARSQTRTLLRRLAGSDADRWRAALRARSDVLRCRVHPAALTHLFDDNQDLVLKAGDEEAAHLGIDLIAVGGVRQAYVHPEVWPELSQQLMVKVGAREPNLVVRIPRVVWPFERQRRVSAASLAADLLESAEPRAVSGGLAMLNRLSQEVARAAW